MSHFKVTIKEDKTYELYNKKDDTTRTYKTKGNCMKQLKKSLDKETAKLVMEGKYVDNDNSGDELDKEIESVRMKQIEMERKIEKRKILLLEQERLLKMEKEYKEMENSFPLVEKKWKNNGKKMENNFPLLENNWQNNGKIMENNFSIQDIDLVPTIESPTMTITRPLKMLSIKDVPTINVPTINIEPLVREEKEKVYDPMKIKIIMHLLLLKQCEEAKKNKINN
tara:strand:+ start:246 stop:920 length:675 start_codon:yes stop_codon:yes gene_type:complete